MITYRTLLSRKYREEATDGGEAGGASTTGVETESNETVLTGDTDDASTEKGGADTNSETDGNTSADDTAATDKDSNSDAGTEGSDTPPDTYADFVLPEGMSLDEGALAEAVPMFKELGLTQEQSQKVIDLYAKQVQAGSEKQVDDFNQLMNDWRDKSQNDREFGGDKFNESVKTARAAINEYGTPELKQLLEDHGVGNHPEVVRFMVRVGRTLKEDVPGSSGSAASKTADRVSILYPNDT